MGRFPLFKRLLLVIFFWPTKVTTGRAIWSQTEGEWKDFNITDSVPPRSPCKEACRPGNYTWNKNVTAHKMEKAILSFPDPVDCDSDRVGKKVEPNVTEILAKIKEIKVNPEESGCQTSVLSKLLKITEGLFSRNPSCAPSWSRVAGRNLWGNKSTRVFKTRGIASVEVQIGREFQSIPGTDARYRLNMTAGDGSNRTFALAILVDHFIEGNFSDALANNTQVAGAAQGRTGQLLVRVYILTTNKTSDLGTPVHNATYTLNFSKCGDVFVVEKFFKDKIENGWRAAPKSSSRPPVVVKRWPVPYPKPDASGVATSPGMVTFYVLMSLTVLAIGGVFLAKRIKKSGRNPCEGLVFQFNFNR